MDCPVCQEAMIVLEHDQIEIDHCLTCKGNWLDRGELALLLGNSHEENDLISSFEIDKDSKKKARKCPICLKKMKQVLCGTEKKVRIDRCPRNDGFWFDMDELDEIIMTGSFGTSTKVLDWLKDVFGKTA